jgi:hypothetical protein
VTEKGDRSVAPALANAQMFASAQLPVIFIDKCHVSGIETMIRDWSLQEITSSARQSAEEHLDFHCGGLAAA